MAKKLVSELVRKAEGRLLLKNVRLSYPFLFSPDEQEDDRGKMKKSYRVALLIRKDVSGKVKKQLDRVIADLCEEEYGKPNLPADKLCLKDGDDSDTEEHHGHWVLSVRETRRPTLVDRDRTQLVEEDEKLQAGHWANVVIRLWAQNGAASKKKNSYGKRINCGFDIVQHVTEDDTFSGSSRPDVDDVLDELDDDIGF